MQLGAIFNFLNFAQFYSMLFNSEFWILFEFFSYSIQFYEDLRKKLSDDMLVKFNPKGCNT